MITGITKIIQMVKFFVESVQVVPVPHSKLKSSVSIVVLQSFNSEHEL